MHDETLPGLASARVRLGPAVRCVARHADVRVAGTKEGVEHAVAAPHEALGAALLLLGFELLPKSRHEPGEETLALPRRAGAPASAVLAEEALAGVIHEGVHVRGELEIFG
jgi:hypothetical protein